MSKRKPGRDFLLCLQFLYREALRMEMFKLAEIIAQAFDSSARLLKATDDVADDVEFAQYNFLRRFLRMNVATRLYVVGHLDKLVAEDERRTFSQNEYGSIQETQEAG